MISRPTFVIIKIIVLLFCINTIQAQSKGGNKRYAFIQGGYFSDGTGNKISGFGVLSFGYLTRNKKNVLEGIELNVSSAFNRSTVRSVPIFIDTTMSTILVGGIVDYFEIDINYIKASEYIGSDKISFGLMSGAGVGFKRLQTDPRIQGGRSVDKTFDIHVYTGPYLSVSLADSLSILIDWNVLQISAGLTTTDDGGNGAGVNFDQGPYYDLDFDGLVNHFHIGVMYTL
jgi:hypothetical protein